MKVELVFVCALVIAVQGTDWPSWACQGASPAKRSLDIFDDFSENYDDSFEDFTPRRVARSQSNLAFGTGFGPSPLNEPDWLVRVLHKRAPPALAERLNLKPLGSKLGLGKTAAVTEVVVEEPISLKPVMKVPAVEKNAISWDKVELPKLSSEPLTEKPVLVAGQAARAERKAAIDALLGQRKTEMLEKRTQLDQTVAQRKALVQTQAEEVLAKIPALKKTESKV